MPGHAAWQLIALQLLQPNPNSLQLNSILGRTIEVGTSNFGEIGRQDCSYSEDGVSKEMLAKVSHHDGMSRNMYCRKRCLNRNDKCQKYSNH